MAQEFRIILTATFPSAADRDQAYTDIKTSLAGFKTTHPNIKRADMTKDDYVVPDVGSLTEKVV